MSHFCHFSAQESVDEYVVAGDEHPAPSPRSGKAHEQEHHYPASLLSDSDAPVHLDDGIWDYFDAQSETAAFPIAGEELPRNAARPASDDTSLEGLGVHQPDDHNHATHLSAEVDISLTTPAARIQEVDKKLEVQPPGPGGHILRAPDTHVQVQQGSSGRAIRQSAHVPALTAEPRGKLQLVSIGEGKCTFVSKNGKTCNRSAPVFKVEGDVDRKCCMCIAKHLIQWRRQNAKFPSIDIIHKTLEQAKAEVYPAHARPDVACFHSDTSLWTEKGQQDKWQTRFVEAALTPYVGSNRKLRDQQTVFNGNVECDTEGHYADDQVNSRMALLYHIAWNIHAGGERLYAVFGDNDGYPKDNRRLTFIQRLEAVEELLRTNKRVVLDVIQGRGVLALVETPDAYGRRKSTNNLGNDDKKRSRLDDEEDEGQRAHSEASTNPLGRARKRRAVSWPTSVVKPSDKGKVKTRTMPVTPESSPSDFGGGHEANRAPACDPSTPSTHLGQRAFRSGNVNPGPSRAMQLNLKPDVTPSPILPLSCWPGLPLQGQSGQMFGYPPVSLTPLMSSELSNLYAAQPTSTLPQLDIYRPSVINYFPEQPLAAAASFNHGLRAQGRRRVEVGQLNPLDMSLETLQDEECGRALDHMLTRLDGPGQEGANSGRDS